MEGGTEVDSCLIQSVLISKKSLNNVIRSLSVNWAVVGKHTLLV